MTESGQGNACAECGAPLRPGRSCVDYLHELLALEAEVPGGAGLEPHFLAVATYNLQHPSGFAAGALAGLRITVSDVLEGRASIADARRRARHASDGPTRVRRRAGDPPGEEPRMVRVAWPRRWPVTVLDVCRSRPRQYEEQVRRWARSALRALETEGVGAEDGTRSSRTS